MPGDAVADFPREIETVSIVFENIDDTQTLLVVIETSGNERTQYSLAGVAKWRMAQVMTQCDGFCELFMEPQDFGDSPRDLRDLERVRQTRSIVIACG